MHNLFFSRLSSYGNYSVSLEVLKLALYQQNYLHASLSSPVKVGRKALGKLSKKYPLVFFLNILNVSGAPEYSEGCLSLRPLDLFDRRGFGLLNNFARRLGKAAQVLLMLSLYVIDEQRFLALIYIQPFNPLMHGEHK